jgi:hypothetical protein
MRERGLTRPARGAQGFDEVTGQVVLKMQGACSGCPSSAVRPSPAAPGALRGRFG